MTSYAMAQCKGSYPIELVDKTPDAQMKITEHKVRVETQ